MLFRSRHPSGYLLDVGGLRVQPGRPEAMGKFDVMPGDVASELTQALALDWRPGNIISNGKRFSYLLASRRPRDTMNSIGTQLRSVLARSPGNTAQMNPRDMKASGVAPGSRIEIASDHGSVVATVRDDDTLREGVISLVHGWGSLPGEQDVNAGTCVNELISSAENVEAVNAMPRMSAIPVNVMPLAG